MIAEQPFIDAVQNCKEKVLTRDIISNFIVADKTNKIKKYLNSYGISQLANHLREIAQSMQPPKMLVAAIDDNSDARQKKVQQGKET